MDRIADRLYSWRHTYRLTQRDAADYLGVTVRTIGRWERGEGGPQAAVAGQLLLTFSKPPASWRRDGDGARR